MARNGKLTPLAGGRETNIEFMSRLMDFSDNGAMMQLFVLDAIEQHAQQVVNNSDKLIADMQHHPISGEAWVACAEEVLREVKQRRARQ